MNAEDRLRELRLQMGLYSASPSGLRLDSFKLTYQEYMKDYYVSVREAFWNFFNNECV